MRSNCATLASEVRRWSARWERESAIGFVIALLISAVIASTIDPSIAYYNYIKPRVGDSQAISVGAGIVKNQSSKLDAVFIGGSTAFAVLPASELMQADLVGTCGHPVKSLNASSFSQSLADEWAGVEALKIAPKVLVFGVSLRRVSYVTAGTSMSPSSQLLALPGSKEVLRQSILDGSEPVPLFDFLEQLERLRPATGVRFQRYPNWETYDFPQLSESELSDQSTMVRLAVDNNYNYKSVESIRRFALEMKSRGTKVVFFWTPFRGDGSELRTLDARFAEKTKSKLEDFEFIDLNEVDQRLVRYADVFHPGRRYFKVFWDALKLGLTDVVCN